MCDNEEKIDDGYARRWDEETGHFISMLPHEAAFFDIRNALVELIAREKATASAVLELARTVERVSFPWYLRWWWRKRAEKFELQQEEARQAQLEKDRAHVIELMKNRSSSSRFRSRW